jgi:microcystin-dependent protein
MSTPFMGEIMLVSFNFAPKGWAECNGQLMPINQNQGLYSLLGTMYGGDGTSVFALPDLRGRVPLDVGSGYVQGMRGGESKHTLTVSEMPQHTHKANATTAQATSDSNSPAPTLMPAQSNFSMGWGPAINPQPFSADAIGQTGNSQAHDNMQPYLVMNFIIALQGIFPSRN